MKTTFYHGTSADNLQDILKYGIQCNTSKIWTCSCDEIYLWSVEELAKMDGQEDEEQEYKEQEAFRRANESGQIACACAKDCRVVVLKIELDEDEVYKDTSCENMESSGAVCIGRDILPEEIIEVKVSNDLSLIKGYFISLIHERDYNNLEFTRTEIKIAEAFKKAEFYIEDAEDLIEFEEIVINNCKVA